jgi:hypothetical protein
MKLKFVRMKFNNDDDDDDDDDDNNNNNNNNNKIEHMEIYMQFI